LQDSFLVVPGRHREAHGERAPWAPMFLFSNRCKSRLCYPAFFRRSSRPGSAWLAALATLDYPQQRQDHDDDQYYQQHVDNRV
jgi:hypothetical protein